MEKKAKTKKIIYWALIAVFAAVFIVSGTIVVDYMVESNEHEKVMDDLRDLHNKVPHDESTPGHTIPRPSFTKPSGSSVPTVPGNSSSTAIPTTPVDPTVPSEPTVPSDPTTPTNPTTPIDPTTPVNPTTPVIPTAPTNPTTPIVPTTPATPPVTEPTVPSTEPTAPPTEPIKPTVPTKPPIVNPTILSEMKAIYDLNKDFVGWVYIKGTNIDYPVVQRKSDPTYYLYRDFYGKKDDHGSIYAEGISDVFTPSDVVVLYGHHMANGNMFNNLKYYVLDYYFKDHRYVQFDTLYTHRKYEVVLLFRTNGEPHKTYPFFPFHTYSNFKNEADFNYFMSSVRKLAIQESDVEVKYGDKLLCLCTCDYYPYPNGRLVLVAKLIEEN